MPDTNWDRYVIKPPKPTFSEKIKEIGKNVNEWKRHKHYRRHELKLKDVAAELGTNSAYLSFYIRKAEDTTFVPSFGYRTLWDIAWFGTVSHTIHTFFRNSFDKQN